MDNQPNNKQKESVSKGYNLINPYLNVNNGVLGFVLGVIVTTILPHAINIINNKQEIYRPLIRETRVSQDNFKSGDWYRGREQDLRVYLDSELKTILKGYLTGDQLDKVTSVYGATINQELNSAVINKTTSIDFTDIYGKTVFTITSSESTPLQALTSNLTVLGADKDVAFNIKVKAADGIVVIEGDKDLGKELISKVSTYMEGKYLSRLKFATGANVYTSNEGVAVKVEFINVGGKVLFSLTTTNNYHLKEIRENLSKIPGFELKVVTPAG
jgi:hypothetical protein